jgi:hypothetical protein
MRFTALFAFLMFMTSGMAFSADQNPNQISGDEIMAAIKAGKRLCRDVIVQNKSCGTYIIYQGKDGSNLIEKATKVISQPGQKPLSMFTSSSLYINKDDMLCGSITQEDIDGIIFISGEQPLPPELNKKMLEQIAPALAKGIGIEACEKFIADGSQIVVQSYLGGKRIEAADARAIWVTATDGYNLGR